MSDNASIARPYAQAVFDLAQETNSFNEWSGALAQLAAISHDEDFSALVSDPRIENDRVTDLLVDLGKDSLPEGGANLVTLLVKNGRVGALADIEEQFSALVAKAQSSVNAHVTTAMALTEDQKASLASALEARLGLKVKLEETVDASLVGGAIVKAGDLVIDGSAKGRIEKLTTALMR
ncbi:MAG: F0F1 ATP synthase subunit delta [Acidiferrobacterales bacterium]|nr:F0F1 ATP synthase subunit delta [Acidiferrobacterales bacterium]